MDGETSYESDISESWSLIDINLNEESLSAAEAYSELERSSQSDVKTEKLKAVDENELEDFVRKCKETNKTDFSRLSDSDSDASCKNQGLPACNGTELEGNDSPKRSSDTDGLHDSGDAESIEILDMEDNYEDSEVDRPDVPGVGHLDFPTYQSDDEESSEGKIDDESRANNSTVIKRRRRRVNRSSEDGVHTVNSENRSSGEGNSTPSSSDTGKESRRLSEEANDPIDGHPVYKHYRNNVANTILSLSVGVIFAGVACIAIGHFLGVQDAAETAVELVETLKKLQVENAALQSRLSHLNRALLTREMNSKLELPLNQPPKKAASEPVSCVDPSKSKQTDLNNAALSEIRSSLNSIEWLSKLQNFVQKNNKVTDTEYGIDFNGFGKFIHDQLHTLNTRQEEGAKVLEDTDRKISKVLHKIVHRLSSSQDHIEKLYEKLIKLKNKLNHKIKRIFPESSREIQSGKSAGKRRVPVTELDLQTMDWTSNNEIGKLSEVENSEPVLYKFPQPESYYDKENDLKETSDKEFERINSTSILKNKAMEKLEKVLNEDKKKDKKEKSEEKKQSKDNWKKKKFKEKEAKEKKGEKRRKRAANKMPKVIKKPENGQKNKIRFNEPRHKKFTHNQNVFNQTIFQNKINPKMEKKDAPSKLRFKKAKRSKLEKVLLSKPKKGHGLKNSKKKHSGHPCPGSGCFNKTGHWVFKWAGGREEIRRHEALGDWQFDRAKVRKELREDEINENWQFERAKARKELRDEDYNENWQFKRAVARENNRNDVRWHRGKYAKYAGKEFFHEGFSWI